MTARTDLSNAQALSAELDQVNAALVVVNAGTFDTFLHIAGPNTAAFRVHVNPTQAALQTLLTNRQTALQNALTALGVT